MSTWLNNQEIIDLTGYQIASKQRQALRHMGIDHRVRPDGTVVVMHCDLGFTSSAGIESKKRGVTINV